MRENEFTAPDLKEIELQMQRKRAGDKLPDNVHFREKPQRGCSNESVTDAMGRPITFEVIDWESHTVIKDADGNNHHTITNVKGETVSYVTLD